MTRILDLCDDCLYEIFSLKYVSASDLCSVAQTCTRLKVIANDIFKKRHEKCIISSTPKNVVKARKIIFNFGPLISQLSIRASGLCDEALMAAVIRYCPGTLESFELQNYGIPVNQTAGLRLLFNKLTKLKINNIYIKGTKDKLDSVTDTWRLLRTIVPGMRNFLGNCKSLIELSVYNCEKIRGLVFDNTFPKLEYFEYDFLDNYLGRCKLKNFVWRHKNLKTFKLICIDDCTPILPVISASYRQLEYLEFTGTESVTPADVSLMNLLTLEKLKILKLSCAGENVTKFIQRLNCLKSLETLHLMNVNGDSEFIPALSQLKNLRSLRLKLCDSIKDMNLLGELNELRELMIENNITRELTFDVIFVIQRLEKLNKLLIFEKGFKLCLAKYLEIVKVVQRRLNTSQRYLQLLCQAEDELADSEERKKYKHIVEMKNLIPT